MNHSKDHKHDGKPIVAPMMKTGAAANYAGVSPRTLEKWRMTRSDLPFYRLGRAIIYSKEDLDSFLEKHHSVNKGEV